MFVVLIYEKNGGENLMETIKNQLTLFILFYNNLKTFIITCCILLYVHCIYKILFKYILEIRSLINTQTLTVDNVH